MCCQGRGLKNATKIQNIFKKTKFNLKKTYVLKKYQKLTKNHCIKIIVAPV